MIFNGDAVEKHCQCNESATSASWAATISYHISVLLYQVSVQKPIVKCSLLIMLWNTLRWYNVSNSISLLEMRGKKKNINSISYSHFTVSRFGLAPFGYFKTIKPSKRAANPLESLIHLCELPARWQRKIQQRNYEKKDPDSGAFICVFISPGPL